MTDTPHSESCDPGRPDPVCQAPDCVAARVWEAMHDPEKQAQVAELRRRQAGVTKLFQTRETPA